MLNQAISFNGVEMERVLWDWRGFRFWLILERHTPQCICPGCVPDNQVTRWHEDRHVNYCYRWYGISFDLPPQRGYGSWYTLCWSWNNVRFYFRMARSAKWKRKRGAAVR